MLLRPRISRLFKYCTPPNRLIAQLIRTLQTVTHTQDCPPNCETSTIMADLQICKTCGIQHSTNSIEELKNECPICLDPRQYVPPTGQAWITLTSLRDGKHKNTFHPMDTKETSTANLIGIRTEPQVAIGQTAYLVRTPEGNVLWDCITYLDNETIDTIKSLGGLEAIAISHPHFFSTHLEYIHCGSS